MSGSNTQPKEARDHDYDDDDADDVENIHWVLRSRQQAFKTNAWRSDWRRVAWK
jgi:hypothetical protein